MTNIDLLHHRLINQQISATKLTQPEEIVAYMGAMQSQEFGSGKWAIGLRLPGSTDAGIEQVFNEGRILRTHVMRPTWHFVAPADIRWMQQLTAHRVHAFNAYQYRKEGLDAATFSKSNKTIIKVLEGGNYATRTVLAEALTKAKIPANGVRLACLVMYAELEGIICSGPRQGKQFTYALMDERITTKEKKYSHEEALHELALRYFSSRSPATVHDFAWWSGLTIKEAKEGIKLLPADFKEMSLGGQEYVIGPLAGDMKTLKQSTFLMPNYDEYGISYKDRSALKSDKNTLQPDDDDTQYQPALIIDGQIGGTWDVKSTKSKATVTTTPWQPLTKTKQLAVDNAASRYSSFINNE